MNDVQGLLGLFLTGLWETLYMVLLSTLLAYIIGLPLGILIYITDKNGITPCRPLNMVLGILINFLRSVPFVILLIWIMPVTRTVVGTTLGVNAMVVPLVIGSAPFIARMVESSLKEVDAGIIEAAEAMGTPTLKIILKVMLPEAKPSLLVGSAITITTILGYSAMSGFTGGGGLGTIAINYGFYRYQYDIMTATVFLLVLVVQVFQEVGMFLARRMDKRIK